MIYVHTTYSTLFISYSWTDKSIGVNGVYGVWLWDWTLDPLIDRQPPFLAKTSGYCFYRNSFALLQKWIPVENHSFNSPTLKKPRLSQHLTGATTVGDSANSICQLVTKIFHKTSILAMVLEFWTSCVTGQNFVVTSEQLLLRECAGRGCGKIQQRLQILE